MNVTRPILNKTPASPRTDYKDGQESFVAQCSKVGCLRPDIFLDSNRYCDCCYHYDICLSVLRLLSCEPESIRKMAKEEYRLACIREREALLGKEEFVVADDGLTPSPVLSGVPEAPEPHEEETPEESEEEFVVS